VRLGLSGGEVGVGLGVGDQIHFNLCILWHAGMHRHLRKHWE